MKGGQGNKSNLRKHLVKHKINLKAEERTVYDSSPAAATANVSTASGGRRRRSWNLKWDVDKFTHIFS